MVDNKISSGLLEELASIFVNNIGLKQIQLQSNPIAGCIINGVLSRREATRILESLDDSSHLLSYFTTIFVLICGWVDSPSNSTSIDASFASRFAPCQASAFFVACFGSPSVILANADSDLMGSLVPPSNALMQVALNTPKSSTLFPDARTAQLISSQQALAAEEDARSMGTYPPLIPSKNSLEHPYYPGFGKGRFSSSCLVNSPSEAMPYTIANSRGSIPVQPHSRYHIFYLLLAVALLNGTIKCRQQIHFLQHR